MLYTERHITGLIFPVVKAHRAKAILDELEPAIESFRKSEFFKITGKDDVKKHLHIKTIEFLLTPTILPLLLGEFLYNLRSSLDQLAWQLALTNVAVPHDMTAFPIRDTQDAKKFRYFTRDLPDEARTAVESFQPYNRADPHKDPLWLLNQLGNLDKHALPAFNSNHYKLDISGANPLRERRGQWHHEYTFSLSDKFKAEIDLTMEKVTLGKPVDAFGPSFEAPLSSLREIHRYVVEDVLPPFQRFFPKVY